MQGLTQEMWFLQHRNPLGFRGRKKVLERKVLQHTQKKEGGDQGGKLGRLGLYSNIQRKKREKRQGGTRGSRFTGVGGPAWEPEIIVGGKLQHKSWALKKT